jgi:GTP cyclohydrolase I
MTSTVPFVSNGVANGSLNPQISARIRERLREAGASFLANDNIADHLQPGELDQLQVEVADKVRDLLRSLVIDISVFFRLLFEYFFD